MTRMSYEKTQSWYENYGWILMNKWLSEFAAKYYRKVYISNFEFIPENIDKEALVQIFNSDSNSWRLFLDSEGDFVCIFVSK